MQKLAVLNAIGGMPSEIIGVTPEGIFVSKQTQGTPLIEGAETSALLPDTLIPVPSRFLRCDRAHPRLIFAGNRPWLIADLHDRNLVHDQNKVPRIIDLVAAPFPESLIGRYPALRKWLDRVHSDPAASALEDTHNDEL